MMLNWFWRGRLRNTLLASFTAAVLIPALLAIAVVYRYTEPGVTGQVAIFVAPVVILLIPVIVVVIRRLLHPLEILVEGVDQIINGEHGYAVDLKANIEIDALAERVNRLSKELKNRFGSLVEQINILEEQKKEIIEYNNHLALTNSRLEMLAITDQLTGAYNRRYIVSQLEQELAITVRHNLPLSIIMIDIDHFKNVNDQHGHHVGDEVLKEMVNVLTDCIRSSDIIGRYGGEEFIVIAPLTSLQEALILAERLRETVSKWPFETTYGFLKLTISLGVATNESKAEHYHSSLVDRLLAMADAEMYRAKAQGRNRVSPTLLEAGIINEAG